MQLTLLIYLSILILFLSIFEDFSFDENEDNANNNSKIIWDRIISAAIVIYLRQLNNPGKRMTWYEIRKQSIKEVQQSDSEFGPIMFEGKFVSFSQSVRRILKDSKFNNFITSSNKGKSEYASDILPKDDPALLDLK